MRELNMGCILTHTPGGGGSAAHLLPWGKGLVDWWTALEVSSGDTGSWAGRWGRSSAVGGRKSGKSAVPSAVGCTALPARGEEGVRSPLPALTQSTATTPLAPGSPFTVGYMEGKSTELSLCSNLVIY